MKHYKVVLEGANYLLTIDDGEPRKYGFVTHRHLLAASPGDAETLARRMICCEPLLVQHGVNGSGDPPALVVRRVQRVFLRHLWEVPAPALRFRLEEAV